MKSLAGCLVGLGLTLFTMSAMADGARTDVQPTMKDMGAQAKILGAGFNSGAAAADLLPAATTLATLVDKAANEAPKQLLDGTPGNDQQLAAYDALIAKLKVQVGLMKDALAQGNTSRAAAIYSTDIRALQQQGHKEFKKD